MFWIEYSLELGFGETGIEMIWNAWMFRWYWRWILLYISLSDRQWLQTPFYEEVFLWKSKPSMFRLLQLVKVLILQILIAILHFVSLFLFLFWFCTISIHCSVALAEQGWRGTNMLTTRLHVVPIFIVIFVPVSFLITYVRKYFL